MACYCKIKKVLSSEEARELNKLLSLVGRKEIAIVKLAELAQWEKSGKCEFLFSWGFNFYCAHPEFIEKFLKDNK